MQSDTTAVMAADEMPSEVSGNRDSLADYPGVEPPSDPSRQRVGQEKPAGTASAPAQHVAALNRFGSQLRQLCQSTTEHEPFIQQLGLFLQKQLGADIVGHVRSSTPAGDTPVLRVLRASVEPIAESLQRWCLSFGTRCIAAEQPLLENDAVRTTVQLFAVPVVGENSPDLSEGIVLLFASPADRHFRSAALNLLTAHLNSWSATMQRRNVAATTSQLAAITDLVARVESTENPEAASLELVEQVKHFLQASHVVVATCEEADSVCQIQAIAGTTGLESQPDPDRLPQALLQETIRRGGLAVWPPEQHDRHALLAHRQHARATGVESIISCALLDGKGTVRGAWMVAGDSLALRRTRAANFMQAASRPLASTLQLLTRAHRNPLQHAWQQIRTFLARKQGRSAMVIATVVIGMLLLPLRYQVSSECELQPVSRRFIAAPFDGKLDESLIQPGDVVQQDQLIARMDGQEIEWELAGVRADLHRATKERAGYIAAHESGKARLAGHEVDRLRSKQELLENRTQNLEIRSPIPGVIVSGDLTKSAGVPLTVGQTLFEVAPLDRMTVELAIPEDDVRFVQAGMPVTIRLDAFPFRKWESSIERVHPRSELKDRENVFIAEATIDNLEGSMRPGMGGSATISTTRHPLGWNLFHKSFAAAMRLAGW